MPVWAQGRISLRSFELMQSLIWRNTETCFTSEAIAQLNFMSVEQEANPRSQSLLCCVNDRLFLSVWSWWRFSVSVNWRMEGTSRLASFLSLLSVVQAPQVGTMLPCQEMLSNNWEIRWLAVVPTFQQFWLEMGGSSLQLRSYCGLWLKFESNDYQIPRNSSPVTFQIEFQFLTVGVKLKTSLFSHFSFHIFGQLGRVDKKWAIRLEDNKTYRSPCCFDFVKGHFYLIHIHPN